MSGDPKAGGAQAQPESGLAHQQDMLLKALFTPRPADALARTEGVAAPVRAAAPETLARGLAAYRSHGRALAKRALTAAYPCLAQRLGEQTFAALAVHFWQRCPPHGGDVAQWGDGLPSFLPTLPDLCADEPCVVDLARMEWALHAMACAPDVAAQLGSLALLTQHEPNDLRLLLAPSLVQIESPWPLAALLANPDAPVPAAGTPRHISHMLAWRMGWRPTWREALPGEAALLQACQGGLSLGQALAAAPDLDFAIWLHQAAQQGLLMGAALAA